MEIMKLSKSHSSQGSNQERASDGSFRSSAGLFRLLLHSLLCVAALVLGFRLSGETRLVVISIKPAHGTFFSNSITRLYRARNFGGLPGAPYEIDDRGDFTSTIVESPPFAKSSRVHVGRHEILVRSWPHPNPIQTLAAHGLIEQVQQEQQRLYGLEERKQVVVITPTYVRAFQAIYLSCLMHTLRIVPGPLVWIVVEAGGFSNETAELLSQSQLSYHHLVIQEPMPADLRHRKQMEIQLRLEGLRFVRSQRLDGIVIFLDDSNSSDLDLFDAVQKIDWFGAFSVGLLFHSEVSVISESGVELAQNSSISSIKRGNSEIEIGSTGIIEKSNIYTKNGDLTSIKGDHTSRFPLLSMGWVCSGGHVVDWYASRTNKSFEWAGFALNSRIFWEDVGKPSWIKSFNELLCENNSLPESPLAFLRNNSYIEPLGDCGRNILLWRMGVEAAVGCKFPSRWIISPPLEVVVPSKKTPWPAKSPVQSDFGSLPPSQLVHPTSETTMRHGKGRVKGAKSRKGKHRSRRTKEDQARSNAEQSA